MDRLNPFSRRETRTRSELATYRVLTLASWALAVAVSVYYSVKSPHGWGHNAHRIALEGESMRRKKTAHPLTGSENTETNTD